MPADTARRDPGADLPRAILVEAARLLPGLAGVLVEAARIGLRSVPLDGRPGIGPVE